MGKWEAYVVCGNSECKPNGPHGHLSWRKVSRGPDHCKFCGTAFRLPASAVSRVSGGTGGNGRGANASGSAAADDWWIRDSKGRTRKNIPKTEPEKNTAEKKPDSKVLGQALRSLCGDDAAKLSSVESTLALVCPPTPKTETEVLADANAAVDRASAKAQHLSKVAEDMQTRYKKDCIALLEYKSKVDAHLKELEEANAALEQSRQERLQLQAKQLNASAAAAQASPAPPSQHTVQIAVEKFSSELAMPQVSSQELSRAMLQIDVVQGMSAGDSSKLQGAFAQMLEQFNQTVQQSVRNAAATAFAAAIPLTTPANAVMFGSVDVADTAGQGSTAADDQISAAAGAGLGGLQMDDDKHMDARESIKRFGQNQNEENEPAARRTRLDTKQAATPQSIDDFTEEQMQSTCDKAIQEASAVRDADVLTATPLAPPSRPPPSSS